MNSPKVPALAIALVSLGLVVTIAKRDVRIQADREASALVIREYEQNVRKADSDLKALEAQPIVLNILDDISQLQAQIIAISKELKSLAPFLESPGDPSKVNKYSQADVDAFNKRVKLHNQSVVSYGQDIHAYQSMMARLNGVIGQANRQYEISVIAPLKLDRTSLSTDKKFFEIGRAHV